MIGQIVIILRLDLNTVYYSAKGTWGRVSEINSMEYFWADFADSSQKRNQQAN